MLALAEPDIVPCDRVFPAVVYMGTDYLTLCRAVTKKNGRRRSTFRTAYDKFSTPVHLIPCNADGAFQLRVMLQLDYRRKLIKRLFTKGKLAPPGATYANCDGLVDGEPFLLSIDMDLQRIAQIEAAAQENGGRLHLFARPCQLEALVAVYGKSDSVLFHRIEDNEIIKVLGLTTFTAEPGTGAYVTPGGETVHSSVIRECREARKSQRKPYTRKIAETAVPKE